LEKDRLGDILIEGERAGVASSDGEGEGEGEAERVGEPWPDDIFSGIITAMEKDESEPVTMQRFWTFSRPDLHTISCASICT